MPYTEGRLRSASEGWSESEDNPGLGLPSQRGAQQEDKVQSKIKFLVGLFSGWDKAVYPGHLPLGDGCGVEEEGKSETEKWFCMSYRSVAK